MKNLWILVILLIITIILSAGCKVTKEEYDPKTGNIKSRLKMESDAESIKAAGDSTSKSMNAYGNMQKEKSVCPACEGTGINEETKEKCAACGGTGTL